MTKGFEFQIEMENPMLEEDHIPSAFSTQISFPPSPVNRRVFGYTPAMFLAPNVKRLEASVWIGGVPFVSGTLVYDGIEDGCLMYTFTEKVVELEGKIWDQNILEFDTESYPAASDDWGGYPLLIRKSGVAIQPFSGGDILGTTRKQKYYNWDFVEEKAPVIFIRRILQNINIFTDIFNDETFSKLAIVGRFREYIIKGVKWGSGKLRVDEFPKSDLAHFLPDISFADLLKGLGQMLCASYFVEGDGLKMVLNKDIISSSTPVDWSERVSDEFSSEEESERKYKFGYAEGDESYDIDNLSKDIDSGEILKIEGDFTPKAILSKITSEDGYQCIFCETTGDIYSGRKYTANFVLDETAEAYECDVVFQAAKSIEYDQSAPDADEYNNSSDFYVARCTPEMAIKGYDHKGYYYMAAIVEPNATSDGRDSKTYIGVLYEDQLFSNGFFNPLTKMDSMFEGLWSITPDALWDKYHKAFAEWLGKTRQRVSVDVNLSPIDLHNFRLYRPVYFKGRKWIVAKLSVTVAAGSEAVSTRGEFIEI